MAILRTRSKEIIEMIESDQFMDLDKTPVKHTRIGDAIDFVCDDVRAAHLLRFDNYLLVSPESMEIQVNGPQGNKINRMINSCVEKTPDQADERWAGESRENLMVLAELHDIHVHKNWKSERILAELRNTIPKE